MAKKKRKILEDIQDLAKKTARALWGFKIRFIPLLDEKLTMFTVLTRLRE